MQESQCIKPIMPSIISLNVVENTIHKIEEQFYEWSYIGSQFATYDEKTDMIIDFVYND